MLLRLTTPISTVCVEHNFSSMTQMDSNTRRRRMTEPGFRVAAPHREWLRNALRDAVRR